MKLIVILLLCANLIYCKLSCEDQWECADVTDDYSIVECRDNFCRCLNEFGFVGNATEGNKCRCSPPSTFVWASDGPRCIECATENIIYHDGEPSCFDPSEQDRTRNRIEVVREIYQNLIFPTPLLILSGDVSIEHLFSPDVIGRITPTGSFDDFNLIEEYFYALSTFPGTQVIDLNFGALIGSGDYVAVHVDILFNISGNLLNLTQNGFFKFDDTDRVSSLDLSILNLGAAFDVPPEGRPTTIQQVCGLVLMNCPPETDPEGFYEDFEDCVSFMTGIQFGTWHRANSNTVVCRQLHSIMTFTRPDIHCSHAGKTGGGACIDFPYQSFYEQSYL